MLCTEGELDGVHVSSMRMPFPSHLSNVAIDLSRSTLDPVLRKEVTGVDWKVFVVAAMAWFYLFATPGGFCHWLLLLQPSWYSNG